MTEDEQKALRALLREEINAAVYASEQRLGGQIGRLDERVGRLDQRVGGLDERVGRLDQRVGGLDERVGRLDQRVGGLDERVGELAEGLGQLDQRVGGLDQRVGGLAEGLGQLDQRVGGLDQRVGGLAEGLGQLDQRMNRFEGRLGKLEVGQQKMQVDLTQAITVLNEATKVINDIQASQIALELKVEDNSRSLKRDMQSLSENLQNFTHEFGDINRKTTERILLHERTTIDKAHPRPNSTA